MGKFVSAYSMEGHSIPLVGDADDARVLPFGLQDVNDHGYLAFLLGWYLEDKTLLESPYSGSTELIWHGCFPEAKIKENNTVGSMAFRNGGFFVMRTDVDRVFIDCGPVGLSGRGGHGHNDCLSFEAILNNVPVVTDSGSYVYTASYAERNRFRSTSMHNTVQIDGEEINRFIHPEYIWNLRNDARPKLIEWHEGTDTCCFIGEHSGYERLACPVTPRRKIVLDKKLHSLCIMDEIIGEGIHSVKIPLHLHDEIQIQQLEHNRFFLSSRKVNFELIWSSNQQASVGIEDSFLSKTYGLRTKNKRISWTVTCQLPFKSQITISPLSDVNKSQ